MFGFFKKKKIEPICKNCRLFDAGKRQCSVVVLHEGKKIHIPVDAEDPCFFEQEYFDPITNSVDNFNEIREIKMWVEDEDGNKSKNGTVKIELPDEMEIKDMADWEDDDLF